MFHAMKFITVCYTNVVTKLFAMFIIICVNFLFMFLNNNNFTKASLRCLIIPTYYFTLVIGILFIVTISQWRTWELIMGDRVG